MLVIELNILFIFFLKGGGRQGEKAGNNNVYYRNKNYLD